MPERQGAEIKSRDLLEKFGKETGYYFRVDHECEFYPDGLFFPLLTSPVCPFCAFVWDDVTKHAEWKKLTKEQQEYLLPIWKIELEFHKKLYYAPLHVRSKQPKTDAVK